jgi:hypothetical protein
VEKITDQMRTLSYVLYPPLLDEVGLAAAVPWYANGFAERSGIRVALDMSEDFGRLPTDVEIIMFRTLQECLINVHRHAQCTLTRISLVRKVPGPSSKWLTMDAACLSLFGIRPPTVVALWVSASPACANASNNSTDVSRLSRPSDKGPTYASCCPMEMLPLTPAKKIARIPGDTLASRRAPILTINLAFANHRPHHSILKQTHPAAARIR